MTDAADHATTAAKRTFAPILSAPGDGPAAAVLTRCDGLAALRIERENIDDAQTLVEHMARLPHRWAPWARLVQIAGEAPVRSMILAEADAVAAELEELRRNALEQKKLAEAVQCYRFKKEPKVELTKGGVPFLVITFREGWERDRFIDWAWNQAEPYAAWHEYFEQHGQKALEKRLLNEMIRKEMAVKKAGMGAGGRRPLRFWRGD